MRVKRGLVSHRKHIKLLKSVSGYRMTKRKLVKSAKEAYLHAGAYAYQGRRNKKSDARKLWIVRISESLKKLDMSYSGFIQKLKTAKILINRKMLSEMLRFDPEGYSQLIDKVKKI